MNVLIVTPGYPPMQGGCEKHAQEIGRNLTQLGHTVTIATGATQAESNFWKGSAKTSISQEEGMTIMRYPIRPIPFGRSGIFAWRKLMVMLSSLPINNVSRLEKMARHIPPVEFPTEAPIQADVIHSLNISWEHGMMMAQQWAKQLNVPHVAAPATHFGSDPKGRMALNSMMQHQRAMLAQAAAVLTMTASEEVGFHAWDLYPRRVAVTSNGLNPIPNIDAEQIAAARQRYGVTQPYFIFIGRTSRDKGAIHAAQAAVQNKQTLVMIGSLTPEFEKYRSKLTPNQAAFVQHLGRLNEKDKHTLIAGSECLLLPSNSESFGIVLLEAWAHGKPVIAANAGGIPSLVRDGVDGLLVPYGNSKALTAAMCQLRDNPTLKNTLGKNGKEKIPQFTWQKVAEKVADVYQDVLR